MSLKTASLHLLLPAWSESLQATHALLVCSAAALFYTVSRFLAAHAAELAVEQLFRLASSPVEATALAMLTAWLLSYSTGCTRVVQLLTLSQLKLVVPALLSYSSPASSPSLNPLQPLGQAPPQPAAATAAATATSPRKELTAHRLAERKGRSPRHKHRWSFDVAPVSGPRREPRQRASSADFRAPAASSGAASPSGSASPRRYPSPQRVAGTPAAAAAATVAEAPQRRGGRQWQPSMQRIASGQQLAELPAPASRRASMDKKRRQPLAGSAHPPCNILCLEPAPAAPVTPTMRCAPSQPVAAAQPALAGQSAAAPPALATAPSIPATPSAAASPPFASLSSWASWTVDSVLRPLLPGASKPAEEPSQGLVRTQSAPLAPTQQPSEPKAPASPRESLGEGVRDGVRALFGGMMRRRSSIDESVRSYTTGGIEADPSRVGKLEQFAHATRLLQARSSPSAGSSPPALPTHLSLFTSGLPPLGPDAGRSTVASVGLDGDCNKEVREVVTDEHLLQFGVVLGEEAAKKVCHELGVARPWGTECSLYGLVDEKGECAEDWEEIVEDCKPGLRYKAWRRPLRRGLYMYRSVTVISGVTPRQLRAFHLDDTIRPHWDDTTVEIERVKPASATSLHQSSEWCLHRFRSRFPMPMAARVYSYARRVWHRPNDGGCYMICRATKLPGPERGKSRAVAVTDYVSSCVIRSAAEGNGAEMESVYFEDSGVRPGLAKMAVPKGLWPFMLKYEAALRASTLEPEARRRASLDGAGRAAGASGKSTGRARHGMGPIGWRLGRAQSSSGGSPPSANKLVRNVVLATGIKVVFDLMAKR